MKKVVSLFMAFVMLISITAGIDMSVFADEYIEIWDIEDLDNINLAMDENYRLMADIDMTYDTSEGGAYNNNGYGWKPIGYDNTFAIHTNFTGTFDGNGHSIIGLNINYRNSHLNKVAAFGLFSLNAGTIKNLHIVDSTINISLYNDNYYTNVGSIAGQNNGLIIGCSFDGVIYDNGPRCNVGGIAGLNGGSIINCFNRGEITGRGYYSVDGYWRYYVGGIFGNKLDLDETERVVENCYNTGDIISIDSSQNKEENHSAGIGNETESNIITNCYNFGFSSYAINSYSNYTYQTIIKNCYCFENSHIWYDNGVVKLNESQATMQSKYQGFDFNNTWIIDSSSVYKYPQLRNNRQDNVKSMDNITLLSEPQKTEYYKNDIIDTTGCQLKINYTNGEVEYIDVTENMTSGYDMTSTGTQTVTVTFRNETVVFDIIVKERPEILNIELLSKPNITTFIKGTKFDFTGAVVRINYSNDTSENIELTTKNVTGYDIDTIGDQTISYIVGGFSVSFNVKVIPVEIEKIEVLSIPNKTEYYDGEDFDSTGLSVKAIYNNGLTKVLDSTDYEISGYGESLDNNTINISYGGVSTSFNIMYHKPDGVWTTITQATCTVDGKKVQYCIGCGKIAKTQTDLAFGHTEITDNSIDATCTKSGLTEGSHCSTCGSIISEQKIIEALGHVYVSEITNNATCTSKGIRTYTCNICGDSYKEEIDMIEHMPAIDNEIVPTCTAGTVITPQDVLNATGHKYATIATEPTCKDRGYTTYTCSVCGDSYKTDYVDVTDEHDYKTVTTTPPTCTSMGIKTTTCSICGDSYTRLIYTDNRKNRAHA